MPTAITLRTRWMRRLDLSGCVALDGVYEGELLGWLARRDCVGMVATEGDSSDSPIRGYMVYELHRGCLKLIHFAAVNFDATIALHEKLIEKRRSLRRIRIDVTCVAGCPWVERHWRTDTVRALCRAEGCYLPILADALQDAGCECEELLSLFRTGGEVAEAVYATLRPKLV